jgi:MoaA/NifB/PqqE/SkfB family radical SAM enzyme
MLNVITCADEQVPGPDGLILRGWFVADKPVRRVIAKASALKAVAVWVGDPRPDVSAALPESKVAARSGYLFTLPTESASGLGQWWIQGEDSKWWQCEADWSSNSPVQRVATFAPEGAIPGDVLTCASDDVLEDRLQLAFARGAGITLRLDLINKCNLRCIMCHYSQDKVFKRPAKTVTPEQFRTLFEGISSAVGEILLSCADEPLASKFFPDILRYLRAVRPNVTIRFCTNAMLMNAALRRLIVEQGVDHVLFSLDGITADTLENIRKGADFRRILQHIYALNGLKRRAGVDRPMLTANFVMMARNIHEAPAFLRLARELGFSYVDYRHLVDCFDGFDLAEEQLQNQPARFNYYRGRILEEAAQQHIDVYLPPALPEESSWQPSANEPDANVEPALALLREFEADKGELNPPLPRSKAKGEPSIQDTFGHLYCTRPFSEITIRDQDEILPCPWHRTSLGRLSENPDLKYHFFGPRFRALRKAMLRPEGDENCQGCPLKKQELPSELVKS